MTEPVYDPEEQANLPAPIKKPHIPIVNGQLQPSDAAGLFYLATVMAKTKMVPKEYIGDPHSIFIAAQLGMEVGLRPMQALQSIAVINGKPTIYADGITGLLHGSKVCEYIKEKFVVGKDEVDPSDLPLELDKWPDNLKAVSEIKRIGSAQQVYRGTFSVADAKRMGKWNKPNRSGKSIWQQYPARMLMWRARTYAARDGFSDVLKGLGIFEEVVDYDADMVDTNGHYEVQEPAPEKTTEGAPEKKEKTLLEEICENRNLDYKKVMEYIEQIHEVTGAPVLAITSKAIQKPDSFEEKFKEWLKGQDDGDPMGIDEPFQDPPAPEIDEDGFSADISSEKKAEIQARTEETKGQENPGSMDNSEGDGDVESESPDLKSATTDPSPSPKSTIKKWIGLRGQDFKDYVSANPGDFDGISTEEYKKAREKWDRVVKPRFQIDWPIGSTEKQTQVIDFPKQTMAQHLAEMKKDYPDEVQKSIENHKFAKGALSEDAAKIIVQDVIDILGGKQIQ